MGNIQYLVQNAHELGYDAYVDYSGVEENPFHLVEEYEQYLSWIEGYRDAIIDETDGIFNVDFGNESN